MNVSTDLIGIMDESDRKGFISFLANRNKRKDARNIDLFKELLSEQAGSVKKGINANAYNVLKKRMTDNLVDYLSGETVKKESSEEISVIRLLVLSRKLFSHDKIQTAFRILRLAEKKAILLNHYSLLNEIYQTSVQYSHVLSDEEHADLIEKYQVNERELVEQGKLNMAFALVHRAYLKAEKGGEVIDLEKTLSNAYTRFNISNERGYNFMSLYRLAQLADLGGASSKQYHSVDLFFVDKLGELEGGPLDTTKHLIYHIDLLYLVANIYFRKHQFEDALYYLEKMEKQMERDGRRYYRDRFVQYTTLKSLCLNYTGKWRSALMHVDGLLMASEFKKDEQLNPLLCKMTIHLQQGQFEKAKKTAAAFSKSDLWYERRLGKEWLLNKNFAEIILHIELNNIDYVESRIVSLKRKLKQSNILLLDPRIGTFLSLIDQLYRSPNTIDSSDFKSKVEQSMEWKPKEQEDVFMMSFYAWLKAKLTRKEVYATTLELFNS